MPTPAWLRFDEAARQHTGFAVGFVVAHGTRPAQLQLNRANPDIWLKDHHGDPTRRPSLLINSAVGNLRSGQAITPRSVGIWEAEDLVFV